MTRKKSNPDAEPNGTPAVAESTPPVAQAPSAEPQTPPQPPPNGNGTGNKPIWKFGPIPTDKDNSVEVAIWAREVTSGDRTFTVFNVTCHASYRDKDGEWKSAKGFRGSQIYALVYCLQKASDWILSQRDPSNPPF